MLDAARADIRIISSGATLSTATTRQGAFAANALAHGIDRQHDLTAIGLRLAMISRAVGKSRVTRTCRRHARAPPEGISHGAADDEESTPQRAGCRADRAWSISSPQSLQPDGSASQHLRECVRLFLHGAAGAARQLAAGPSTEACARCDTENASFTRCRRARRADRRRRDRRFLPGVKRVFSGTGYRPVSSHRSPPWLLRPRNRRRTPLAVEHVRNRRRQRLQRLGRIASLGTSEMGSRITLPPLSASRR